MFFLALETSCDETAAAVFNEQRLILSSVVASQTELHSKFGGVVPEIASRAHLKNLLPVVDEALRIAGITPQDLGCIAVHNTPGLVGSLVVGVSAAKMLAVSLGVPLIGVNHIAGHIYACRLAANREIFPCLGFVVSGGHTALFRCDDALSLSFLGGTRDDAAGEAFDKVAALLGLGFPGGPALEREARTGDPTAYKFPRSFLREPQIEFSFSGLKTAVLYACHGQNVSNATPPGPGQKRADLAASFQAAVVEALVGKCEQALKQTGLKCLAVGGGVTANQAFRQALQVMCDKRRIDLVIPPMNLCTDNAAMAALAVEKYERQQFATLDLDAEPSFL
ncbi:MAG: tRNA (adenosine(37)-N6)-threonylcarbamoyltransferase complex transferase subunit TsaD [Fimbriiglobus sp.]